MRKKRLKGLAYYGGKSPNKMLSRWIASMLPYDNDTTYVEPFAGMLGVLLCRPKVKIEMVNDIDGNLINWWKCIRDYPDELARLTELTPISRDLFAEAKFDLVNKKKLSPLKRALAFHIICERSIMHGNDAKSANPSFHFAKGLGFSRMKLDTMRLLAVRLRDVQIESIDALALLEKTVSLKHTVIYCDPPYGIDADTSPYMYEKFDKEGMTELLKDHKGTVAVSGYGADWDHLGWNRFDYATKSSSVVNFSGRVFKEGTTKERVEVLWVNFKVTDRFSALRVPKKRKRKRIKV